MYPLYNILNPKNVLGGKGVMPLPDPIRSDTDYILRSATTGAYETKANSVISEFGCRYTDNTGVAQDVTSLVDPEFNINVLANTDIYVSNNANTSIWESYIDKNTNYIVLCSCIGAVRRISDNPDGVYYVDMRNAGNLYAWGINTPNLKILYAKATSYAILNFCLTILGYSTVENGIVYVNPNEAYAHSVISVARSKGWRVYYL